MRKVGVMCYSVVHTVHVRKRQYCSRGVSCGLSGDGTMVAIVKHEVTV
jgi:hypothetical protein